MQCVQSRRFAIARNASAITKAEFGAAHSRKKRQAHFIRVCRLIFINITLSNRIVMPNNRYTRKPASHDFMFYSVPDKVYVLTATNRIAMRFAVHSAPAFRYRTKRTDYSKGGIWSGSQPQAELEAAHSAKTAGTFYPCLPFIVSIVYPVKPHCKAKQSLYTETRFTRFSVLLCA